MHQRCTGLHGLLRVKDRGQQLVLDVDQFQRLLRDLFADGRHCGQAVADETHLGVEYVLVLDVVQDARGGRARVKNARHVVNREDRLDARQRPRPAGVHAQHPGMRVRAALDLAIQHAGQQDICRVARCAGHLLDAVHPGRPRADHR